MQRNRSNNHAGSPYSFGGLVLLALAAAILGAAQASAAPGSDTMMMASGLKIVFEKRSKGARPKNGQIVLVHYTGTLTDGTTFDDSRKRGEPFAFALGKGQVIKGWDEGIAMLRVGERARLIIPAELGYGERGAGNGRIPPNATLIFDVELMGTAGKSLGTSLFLIAKSKDGKAARAFFNVQKRKGFKGYYVSESDINSAGYRMMRTMQEDADALDAAIALFEINVELYPKSANVYDSLGEAYMNANRTAEAIANYRKSLELDPTNQNATDMLKKLENGK